MRSIIVMVILALGPLHIMGATPEDYKVQPPQKIEEQKQIGYTYIKLSDQWMIFPGLGIGYRSHSEESFHGFDMDLSAYSYWDAGFSFYGKSHYLFYPRQKHFYSGVGVGIIGGWFSTSGGGGPLIHCTFGDGKFIKPTVEGVIGCEWETEKRKIFLQFELGGSYGECPLYPAISLGVGF